VRGCWRSPATTASSRRPSGSDWADFYFHITTTYAILRMLGVPVGKADYMRFLLPHVRSDG